MKEIIKNMFDTNKSIRMTLFNIITFTVVVLGLPSIAVMLIGGYGDSQIPSIIFAIFTVLICMFIANKLNKLNLAASIIISVCTFILFPAMFFFGGGIQSGMPLFFALGMVFLFMLVEGKAFYCLFIIQIVVYTACFYVAFKYPGLLTSLGSYKDIYIDIYMCILIVGLTIGLINKFQTRAYDNVIKTVNEKNIALQESEKKAEFANRAKTDFLSNMSHEIRTPINAIIGMNEMIKREATDNNILEYAEIAGSSANALLAIINDILDFARIESGKMEIVNEKYELYSLINDCYNMIRDRAKEKDLEVVINCDSNLPAYMIGDMLRIRQVIVNLLTNAVKYTGSGTVTLTVSGEKTENGISLRFDVSDTGIGMKQENLDKLFKKFERLDLEHNRTIEGTGLGLSIVNDLVSLMNGTVSVRSIYGKGSTFTVVVPQNVMDFTPIGNTVFGKVIVEHVIAEKQGENVISPGSRILVVDDVQMNLLVFKKLVKDTKIHVDTAISGKVCLDMIEKVKYDLIFMDHMMPEMDGVETFDEIRRRVGHENTETPVVMLTANALVGMEEKYLSYGFSDYITKPIDITKLEAVLRKYLKTESEDNSHEEKPDGRVDDAAVRADNPVMGETAESDVKADIEPDEENATNVEENTAALDIKQETTETEINISYKTEESEEMDLKIDTNVGIMNCGGSKDFYIEVIEAYEEEGKKEELITAFNEKNWELYTIDAHSLKGTMRLLGAETAGEMGEKLQFAGEANDIDTILSLHEQFVKVIDDSVAEIKNQIM